MPYLYLKPVYKESSKSSSQGGTSVSLSIYRTTIGGQGRVSCGSLTVASTGVGVSIAGLVGDSAFLYAEAYVNGALKQSVALAGSGNNMHAIALGYGDISSGKVLEGKCFNSEAVNPHYYADLLFGGAVIG